MNQYDSRAILSLLERQGYQTAQAAQTADVVIINSCTVTASSDSGVRKLLRRTRRENPSAVIVLTGCMPQAFPEAAASFSEADVITGTSNRGHIPQNIMDFLSSRQQIVDIAPHSDRAAYEELPVKAFEGRTRAFLKIEDGCNRFCSYCIIPHARGRVRSKPLADLRREAAELAEKGYRELVLTGINLSAYGQDLDIQLCDAVESVCEIPNISRVRLGSLEPERLDAKTIKRLATQRKLCPQFHLSLQSGCNRTLQSMNRHYVAEEYNEIVHQLRLAFPNAAVTTDVMVGFPGESTVDFEESLHFVKKIDFAKAHIFSYSKRPGTPAAARLDQISEDVKKARSKAMLDAAAISRAHFLSEQLGTCQQLLIERTLENGMLTGYTDNYTPVHVKGACKEREYSGTLVSVRITNVTDEHCLGELLEETEIIKHR